MTEQKIGKNTKVDFYEVFGLKPTATQQEIKQSYSKLIIKYHPDKVKVKDEKSTKLFELIQRAYETLGDELKRSDYDKYITRVNNSKLLDHFKLKNSYNEYIELENKNPKTKEQCKIEYDQQFLEFDAKHNYDRTLEKEKITKEELKSKKQTMFKNLQNLL
jgi:curved DNA-binding protein CbpA